MSLAPYLTSGYSKHDGLPPGQWVIDRRTRVLRYEIDHETALAAAVKAEKAEPPRAPKPSEWKAKTCPCGEPTRNERAYYCHDCYIASRRRSWRESARRKARKESIA